MAKRDGTGINRRGFLRAGVGAAVAWPLGVGACQGRKGDQGDPDGAEGGDGGIDVGSTDAGGDGGLVDQAAPLAWDPDEATVDEALFPLGVQAGVVRGVTATLWGWTPEAAAKTLRIWRDSDVPGEVLHLADVEVAPAAGALRAEVTGLAPGRVYRYAWLTSGGSARSVAGTFRAALEPGERRPLTVAATACTHFARRPYQALLRTADHDFDLFCQLGDMGYFDEALTLAEYRALWNETLSDPGYRAILRKAPVYATLDDHEVVNSTEWPTLDPARLEAALEAWYEKVPLPNPETRRVWDAFRWGETLEVIVLDSRTERDYATYGTPDPIYLSKAQLSWLQETLLQSPCHFKLVLSSVPITRYPNAWPEKDDRWEGWPEQREALLDFIVQNDVRNVWFLAGDLHHTQVGRIDPGVPARRRLREVVVSGEPSFTNPIPNLVERDPSLREDLAPADQFDFLSSRRAATLLTFDPDADAVRCLFVDAEDGSVLFDAWMSEEG